MYGVKKTLLQSFFLKTIHAKLYTYGRSRKLMKISVLKLKTQKSERTIKQTVSKTRKEYLNTNVRKQLKAWMEVVSE